VFVAMIAIRRGHRQQLGGGELQAETGRFWLVSLARKKDEDLFDKYLHFSVNTSRLYYWHCSSVGLKRAKLYL
jgi:hypothetical protein